MFSNMNYQHLENGVVVTNTDEDRSSDYIYSYELAESITDDPSDERGVKACDHTKTEITRTVTQQSEYHNSDFSVQNKFTGIGSMWYNWMPSVGGHYYPLDLNESVYPIDVRYHRDADRLVADTVHDFYTLSKVDNLVNGIEAPELISSLKSLKGTLGLRSVQQALRASIVAVKPATNNREVLRAYRHGMKHGRKALSRANSDVSNGYLLYSFGIAPLIRDMQTVKRSMRNLRKEMNTALKSQGKEVSIHRSDVGTVKFYIGGVAVGSHIQDGDIRWDLSAPNIIRTCTVRGVRENHWNTKLFSEVDYLISRFIATGPATTAWELTRFSFIVDWFADLRNITDRLDNLLTGSRKKIKDVCISSKSEYKLLGSLHLPSRLTADEGTVLCDKRVSHYHREPVTDYNIVGSSGRFGKHQATLLGALVHQKMTSLVKSVRNKT